MSLKFQTDIDEVLRYTEANQKKLDEFHSKSSKARSKPILSGSHIVSLDPTWDQQLNLWSTLSENDRHSLIYSLTSNDGATITDICKYLQIKKDDLKPYISTYEMGRAALKLKINRMQIDFGSETNQPSAKIHLGKQFAEQVDNPVHDDDTTDNTSSTITINVINSKHEDV